MSRFLVAVAALVVLLPSSAAAQSVRVVKKEYTGAVGEGETLQYDLWTTSGALRDDKEPSVLGGMYKTQAEAVAAANRWLASNHEVSKPSDWTYLKFVVVEGEASVRTKGEPAFADGNRMVRKAEQQIDNRYSDPRIRPGENPNRDYKDLEGTLKDLQKDTRDTLKKLLKKKEATIKGAVERVTIFKKYMVRNVDKLTDDDFKKVNGLIATYNKSVTDFRNGPNGQAFAGFPLMPGVKPGDFGKKAKEATQAAAEKDQLDAEKQKLDEQKQKLDAQRKQLYGDGKDIATQLKDTGDEAAKVRAKLQSGGPRVSGKWEPVDRGYWLYDFQGDRPGGKATRSPGKGNIDDSTKIGTWRVKDSRTIILDLPASGRPGYSSYAPAVKVEITIGAGNEMSVAGAKYRGGTIRFEPPPDKDKLDRDLKAVEAKQQAAQKSRAGWADSVRDYKARKDVYDKQVADFNDRVKKYADKARLLEKDLTGEQEASAVAIANGHAFAKHAREFPEVRSVDEFLEIVEGVIAHPTDSKKLRNGRIACYDAASNTLVILDPSAKDGGTCFRPKMRKQYFDALK